MAKKTNVCFKVKDTDTWTEHSNADFYLYHVDVNGNEDYYNHMYMNGAEEACIEKPVDEKFHVKLVNIPGMDIEEPEDGIYCTFNVSTSSPQHITIEVTKKKEKTSVSITVKDVVNHNVIEGAKVKIGSYEETTDTNGKVSMSVESGTYTVEITKTGYKKKEDPQYFSAGGTYELSYSLDRNYNMKITFNTSK